jgi:hypothetical protein
MEYSATPNSTSNSFGKNHCLEALGRAISIRHWNPKNIKKFAVIPITTNLKENISKVVKSIHHERKYKINQ